MYDVNIEGVSLVANYRAQFNKVIRSESYEALIARLKSNRSRLPGGLASGTPVLAVAAMLERERL